VLKSGNLNLLEPFGPVQACNGIALPLPLPILEPNQVAAFPIYIQNIEVALRFN
jgi:hypothetical protein